MAEAMRAHVAELLKGIDRYNPENLATLERYIAVQAMENAYDLEANLAVLKLYQFNPNYFQTTVTAQILLKALTNLPHTDLTLCKCLIEGVRLEEKPLTKIIELADLLESCQFKLFWRVLQEDPDIIVGIQGFEDSIRKFICHVVGITYQTIEKEHLAELLGGIPDAQTNQWISKYGWKIEENGQTVFVANQEENIKTKNITEKITFENVAQIMAR
ncbi:eukaryotic translation initiation factor 3 subunit K [Lingula anatina]|nr:eukaryotic translation initiation factor 3 subunit K [Lingula anatina]|eukprot:XP_013395948.1 eukaryotic translation initiation factor 3 subunit K [Lingula anatina]